jgi:hypothetical protein
VPTGILCTNQPSGDFVLVIGLGEEKATTDFSDWRRFGEFDSRSRHIGRRHRKMGEIGSLLSRSNISIAIVAD